MKQLKLYLDTNMSERFFKNAILSKRNRMELKIPKIFEYLTSLDAELFVSSFSLAEIYEHMWKKYQAKPNEISEITQNFLEKFKIRLVLNFEIKSIILRWIRKRKLEAKDVIHLLIAKNLDIYLLSDDDDFTERAQALYRKIIPEKNLRFFISSFQSSNDLS